ncbi:MAG: tyrosine-type recombinase/integrase [Candidatus Altiarchaeales archaeon]|nr:tyrosine-type recombinase/integrase [Candidatus Altiarchaeales archaeon]MBD3416792.1 tyrosine-type recombinase/integrase [Candidatus Altiarchaeales archaeon]
MDANSIYRGKYTMEFEKNRFNQNPRISQKNKDAINEFINRMASEGIGKMRIRKYYGMYGKLMRLTDYKFDFLDATEKDLRELVTKINFCDSAAETKKDLKVAVKKFYKVMNGGKLPEKVEFIKCTVKRRDKKLPEQLLAVTEVTQLIRACKFDRDRAIISLLYYGGLRVGELGGLRIKDIVFEENGVRVHVQKGKTGARSILVLEPEQNLRVWIRNHPYGDDIESPLWIDFQYKKPIRYDAIRLMIKRIAKQAGIPLNKCYPHNFRHSRATELAKIMTESQLCAFFGWVMGSDMAATYVHLSGRDIDDVILGMNGIKPPEPMETREPRKCGKCNKVNPPDGWFCNRCATPLIPEALGTIEQEEQEARKFFVELYKNREFRGWLETKFRGALVGP